MKESKLLITFRKIHLPVLFWAVLLQKQTSQYKDDVFWLWRRIPRSENEDGSSSIFIVSVSLYVFCVIKERSSNHTD